MLITALIWFGALGGAILFWTRKPKTAQPIFDWSQFDQPEELFNWAEEDSWPNV